MDNISDDFMDLIDFSQVENMKKKLQTKQIE